MKFFKNLWWYFKQEKLLYILSIVGAVCVGLLRPVVSDIIRILIDKKYSNALTSTELIKWVLLLLLAGIFIYITRETWELTLSFAASKLARSFRNKLYVHFSKLPPEFYNRYRIGDLMARASNDILTLERSASGGSMLFQGFVIVGGLLTASMIILVSWKLTVLTLMPMVLLLFINKYYSSMLQNFFRNSQEAFSDLNSKVQENISGMRVIKSFGLEEAEKESFKTLSKEVVNKNLSAARINSLYEPSIQLIIGLCYLMAISFGSLFVFKGEITIGQLTQFTILLSQLISPMLAFGFAMNNVEKGNVSYLRIVALLDNELPLEEHEEALNEVPMGSLSYQIDTFYYPEQKHFGLKDINLNIKRGQTLGITGKHGSGKTTFLRQLLREFHLENGEIKIGEKSIYNYKPDALRKAIGYVPQEHFLFSATVAENIAFGKPDASSEEIQQAAMLASIDKDIESFENGYDTLVGERGVILSGGQKQRISIARALLLDPEILILDDCLSAVDATTEKAVLDGLKKTRAGKTTLISSHRLSTIEHADLIIVFDDGKILEQGTHQQLIDKGGWYGKIFQQQQLEAIVKGGGIDVNIIETTGVS